MFNENISEELVFAEALAARITRQKAPLRRMTMSRVLLLANAGTTANLLQETQEWCIEEIFLQGDFGEDGWSWLAEGLWRNRGKVEKIWLSREVMAKAKIWDLRAVL